MKDQRFEIFYPSWTRKSLTFSIDDGNIPMDKKMLSILVPCGIKGTFNLSRYIPAEKEAEYYDLYKDYDVANHVNTHPFAFPDDGRYIATDVYYEENMEGELNHAYPMKDSEGSYRLKLERGWRTVVDNDAYIRLTESCSENLMKVLGRDKIKDFVWPFFRQQNSELYDRLVGLGFRSLRGTNATGDTTGFALPENLLDWCYNATHRDLLEVMELYDKYEDDGELKFFAFGVHSVDYENEGKWGELQEFAEKYGNRPEEYWYAGVGEIFDYAEAVDALTVENGILKNNSEIPVYVKVRGEKHILGAGESVSL